MDRARVFAYVVSVAVIAALIWPAFRAVDADDFPLSTYPMFARPRSRVNEVVSAIAKLPNKHEAAIPPRYIANAEAMQAVQTLRAAIDAGPDAASALCTAIAARLASADDDAFASAVRVELVTQHVDSIAFLAGRATPSGRRVHARCRVQRATTPSRTPETR